MNRRANWTSLAVAALLGGMMLLSGCYGLSYDAKGRFYQTEKASDLDSRTFIKIGVYTVADGSYRAHEGNRQGIPGWGVLFDLMLRLTLISRSHQTDPYGFRPDDFPAKIALPFEVSVDSSVSGTNMDLALALQRQLTVRGFMAEVAVDAPNQGIVTSDTVLGHARSNGYDAAFVTVYRVFTRWQELVKQGTSETTNSGGPMGAGSPIFWTRRITMDSVDKRSGFLFIPSAALIDVRTGSILWSSAYYGLVSHAHVANISDQAFSVAINKAIIENGREQRHEAANVMAEELFNPRYWKGSYKAFPTRK